MVALLPFSENELRLLRVLLKRKVSFPGTSTQRNGHAVPPAGYDIFRLAGQLALVTASAILAR